MGRVRSQIFPLVLGRVGLSQSADGLDRVTQNGPMDNSGQTTFMREIPLTLLHMNIDTSTLKSHDRKAVHVIPLGERTLGSS